MANLAGVRQYPTGISKGVLTRSADSRLPELGEW